MQITVWYFVQLKVFPRYNFSPNVIKCWKLSKMNIQKGSKCVYSHSREFTKSNIQIHEHSVFKLSRDFIVNTLYLCITLSIVIYSFQIITYHFKSVAKIYFFTQQISGFSIYFKFDFLVLFVYGSYHLNLNSKIEKMHIPELKKYTIFRDF